MKGRPEETVGIGKGLSPAAGATAHPGGTSSLEPRSAAGTQKSWLHRSARVPAGTPVAGALARSSVLVVGAGGLGSPAALALARAGVGCIGVADDDRVELSNLHRQLLHGTPDLGRPKVDSARERLRELNPALRVEVHPVRLGAGNILPILEGYDLVVEGSDNLPTKFLVNDAAYFARKPAVTAAVLRFFGQLLVVMPGEGPCYRCVFGGLPPPDVAPSCQEAGVLGAVPGLLGGLQAAEAVKLLAGVGEPLREAIFLADTLTGRYERVEVRRNPECPLCGQNPRILSLEEENYRHPAPSHAGLAPIG